MEAEILAKYKRIVEITLEQARLEEEKKALKADVVEYHAGRKTVNEDGYESVVKHTVRDTPQLKVISEKFGIPDLDWAHHPECFKRAEFDSVTVKCLLTEG